MAEISTLPFWKKDASAYERLSELALLAKEHPERFNRFVVVYEELLSSGRVKPRTLVFRAKDDLAMDYSEQLGLLQIGILKIWDDTKDA